MPYNRRTGEYYESRGRQSYSNNYQRNDNRAPRKKSGCSETVGRTKKTVISGWRKSARQFMTFVATQNNGDNAHAKGGAVITNKKGQEYTRWTAKLTNKTIGTVSTVSCLYNHATGKLYFPDLNLVANPKAPNGGYWGKSSRPKR
ncbi:hypothetical protein ACRTDU_04480 [Sunxiuqinia elliptica]